MKIQKKFNAHYDEARICEYAKLFNLDKKIIELLFSRGMYEKEVIEKFLNPTTNDFLDPYLLSGMKEGVERIKKAIRNHERILIFGDYDVDGISATAIMIKMFKKFGIDVNYYLPNRFIDGYGLTIDSANKVINMFHPNLIITVDCGITCVKEVEHIKSLGIDIIVTDHHELDERTPNTICINPKIPNQAYPFSGLCGAGVAYKIAQAILEDKCDDELLAICAVATIADIVPLTDENRAIVHFGLKCMNALPKGLKAIFKENKIDVNDANSTDISFKVSPKLNASGRMGEANDSLKLYLEKDSEKIKTILEKINDHNKRRQQLCSQMYDDCLNMLKDKKMCDLKCIILSSDNWDSGILGIIAARLVDKFHRPAFLFAESDGVLKGSGRSIDDINIHDILLSSGDLLTTFGGHSMAAGLSLKKENFGEFKERVKEFIDQNVNDKIFNSINYYDLDLCEEDINENFIKQLDLLEPFGCSNPKPYFKISAKNLTIQPLKNFKNHANFCYKNLKLICFNYIDKIDYINFAKDYGVVFEFQQSFSKKEFKGLIKYFDFNDLPTNQIEQYVSASPMNQFAGFAEKIPPINYYKERELASLVLDSSSTAFGTLFVCYNLKTYVDFFTNYETSMIEQFYLFDMENNGGFNSIILAPNSTECFCNYNKIIFLDSLISSNFLNIENATIYAPAEAKFRTNFLDRVEFSRERFAEVYGAIKSLEKTEFVSIQKYLQAVQKYLKKKISFNQLLFVVLVFEELGILSKQKTECGFSYVVNNVKSRLENSTIYNQMQLLYKTTRGQK